MCSPMGCYVVQYDNTMTSVAGAVFGMGLSAMFAAADDPDADIASLLDEGLAQLEVGLLL